MKKILFNFKFQIIILILISIFGMFAKLGDVDLPPLGSALHAGVSREILRTNDWLTLHCYGCEPYKDFYQFPPLFFYLTAITFKLFGINDFTAKSVSSFFGVGVIILTIWLGYLLFGKQTAYFSGFVIVTTQFFYKHARGCELETILIFFSTLAMIFFILGEKYNNKYFLLFGISSGLAFLSKGPPGYVSYCIVILYIILSEKWKLLKDIWLWRGFVYGSFVPLLWIVPQLIYEEGKFYNKFILNQILWSLAGRDIKFNIITKFLSYFYYVPVIVSYYLPWGLLGVYFIYKLIKINFNYKSSYNLTENNNFWFLSSINVTIAHKELLILFIWIACVWIGFSIPGYKDNYYLLLFWPAWCVVCGYYLETHIKTESTKMKYVISSIILLLIIIILTFFTPVQFEKIRNPEFKSMATKVKSIVPKEKYIYIYKLDFWDFAALVPWYIDRGIVFPELKSNRELAEKFITNPEIQYCFFRKEDYNNLYHVYRNNTTELVKEGRYVLVVNTKIEK